MGRKEKIVGEESVLQLFHPLSVPPYCKPLWRCVATRAAPWPLRSGGVASIGLVWLLDSLSLPWFPVITVLPPRLLLPDVDLLSQLFLQHLGLSDHRPPLAVLSDHQRHLVLRLWIAAVVNAHI